MPTPGQAGAAVASASVLSAGSYGIYHYTSSTNETTEDLEEGGQEQQQNQESEKKRKEVRPDTPTPSKTPQEIKEPTTVETFKPGDLTGSYSGKLLTLIKQDNLQHIVKPTSNKVWWAWKWDKLFKGKEPLKAANAPFDKVSEAYSEKADSKSLNQACNTAYEKGEDAYTFTGEHNLLDNIKKFCSKAPTEIDLSEPKATPAVTKTDNDHALGVLSVEETSAKLVKAEGKENDLWFKWAFEKRMPKTKTGLSSLFANVSNSETLKTACADSYKKNKHELADAEPNKTTILKDIEDYCTITPETLTAPNKVPASEPTNGVVAFSASDTFVENKTYHKKVISFIKKENLEKIVKPNEKANKTWWDWAFKNKYEAKKKGLKDQLDPIFQELTSSYKAKPESGDKQTSLNQACHKAYDQEETAYQIGDKKYLLDNIGHFCTRGADTQDISEPLKPELMGENDIDKGDYTKGIFKGKNNKDRLVKVKGTNNKLWWEWVFQKVFLMFPKTNEHFTRTRKVKIAYAEEANTNGQSNLALNHACDAAYQKPSTDLKTGQHTLFDDIQKFCTLPGKTLDSVT